MKTRALNTILENAALASQVQSLPSVVLVKLVEHIGLENAGPIIEVTTSEQLQDIVDSDLWNPQRGRSEEAFNCERFLTWIEVLFELGEKKGTEKFMELEDELILRALTEILHVFDVEQLSSMMNLISKELTDIVEAHINWSDTIEIDRYVIVFKKTTGSGPLSEILLSWSSIDYTHFCNILDRCARHTLDHFDEVDFERADFAQHTAEDALDARNSRRSEKGYVSQSDAFSFLNLARIKAPTLDTRCDGNPIFQSYLRNFKVQETDHTAQCLPRANFSQPLINLIEEICQPNLNLPLLAGQSGPHEPSKEFLSLLYHLQTSDPLSYERQMRELAFLGNSLLVGASIRGRNLRASESVRIIHSICKLGIEHLLLRGPLTSAQSLLQTFGSVTLFEVGWNLIYQKVTRPTLEALIERLSIWAASRSGAKQDIIRLQQEFRKALKQETPWSARDKVTWLTGRLGQQKVMQLQSLIDECPHQLVFSSENHRIKENMHFFATLEDVQKAEAFLMTLPT